MSAPRPNSPVSQDRSVNTTRLRLLQTETNWKLNIIFKRRRIKHDKGCSNPCVSYVKWRISAFNLAHKRRLSPINRRIANRKRQINQHNRAETPSNRDAAPIENRTVSPPNKYREEKNISKRRISKRRISWREEYLEKENIEKMNITPNKLVRTQRNNISPPKEAKYFQSTES